MMKKQMAIRGNLWVNPFEKFLTDADSSFQKIISEPVVHSDASLVPRFVQITEDLRFVFDIVDRVDALAAAFDRLRELYKFYMRSERQRQTLISAARDKHPGRNHFDIPRKLQDKTNHCLREAQALVAFAYYEMSALAGLLRSWLAPSPGSHLEYLVGVRNKLLTHPRRDGRIKNSKCAVTVGPILHAHLVGATGWVPLIRDWYLKELSTLTDSLDDDAGTMANIALLRDRTRTVEKMTRRETLQLKAYTIPEPDLLESAREMAALLCLKFSREIERRCAERVK